MIGKDRVKIQLQVIEAVLTRNTEGINTNPFIIVEYTEHKKHRYDNSSAGNITPKWNQTFDVLVDSINEELTFSVYDDES